MSALRIVLTFLIIWAIIIDVNSKISSIRKYFGIKIMQYAYFNLNKLCYNLIYRLFFSIKKGK